MLLWQLTEIKYILIFYFIAVYIYFILSNKIFIYFMVLALDNYINPEFW